MKDAQLKYIAGDASCLHTSTYSHADLTVLSINIIAVCHADAQWSCM